MIRFANRAGCAHGKRISRGMPRTAQHVALRRRDIRRCGATCVEMALIAPVVFLFFFASIEFSRVLMVKQVLTNSAREGTRVATLGTTVDTARVDQAVRKYLKGSFTNHTDPVKLRVSITPGDLSSVASGTPLTTTIEVNMSEVSWLLSGWTGDVVVIASSTMFRE